MTRIRLRQSCVSRRQPRQWKRHGSKQLEDCKGPGVTNPTIASLEHPTSASQDEDSEDMEFSAPRKSQRSAPQLQAQLFTVHRPDSTQAPEGHTLLQRSVTAGFEDRRLVPHRTGGVLTPHDYNLETGHGQDSGECPLCGLFLDPLLEHGETCSTAEATRGHSACVHAVVCGSKLADPGITTGPSGLTALQSRPADPLLSQNAVRPWVCMWLFPSQRQLAERPHRRHFSVRSKWKHEIQMDGG